MTPEEIRKLLGGYATNTLTDDERKALFEAALDDQELFNALENEDALRELIDDPLSRNRVRVALQSRHTPARRPGFWSRRWMFGVAIPAVAAVIVIAVMNRANAPGPVASISQKKPVDIASNDVASNREATPREAKPEFKTPEFKTPEFKTPEFKTPELKTPELKKESQARNSIAPPPAVPAPAQLEAPHNGAPPQAVGQAFPIQAFRQQSQAMSAQQVKASLASGGPPQIPDAIRQQFSAGFAANIPLYEGPLLRYSLLRSGPAGDEVRVEVSTTIAGYLALYQIDSAGISRRVYPASDPAALVLPNLTAQIPASPIKIANFSDKLRLVVVPADIPPALMDRLSRSVTKAVEKTAAAPTPLVVDIALGKN
jgi:hypothetical protein